MVDVLIAFAVILGYASIPIGIVLSVCAWLAWRYDYEAAGSVGCVPGDERPPGRIW